MTDYEKLFSIVSEIDNLISRHVQETVPAFEAWHTKAERFLIKKYGKDSLEHKKFLDTHFSPRIWFGADEEANVRNAISRCCDGLRSCKAVFETYLEDMADEEAYIPPQSTILDASTMDKVFIVHGHDGELKHAVARLVEKQGVEAIILSEQANKGKTIIEKFEENSDVSGAICLFTADDLGRTKATHDEQLRARQNVVFEAGYFMGKLGRNRVVIIAESGMELPSDMQGIVYTNKNNWEVDVLRELNAMGYAIDLNKLFGQ